MRTQHGTDPALRRGLVGRRIALAVVVLMALTAAPAIAADTEAGGPALERVPVEQEWNFDGTPIDEPLAVGTAQLSRRAHRLTATARLGGLIPGGVYTFWWIVVQEDGTFPEDIYVASGDGVVVGGNGRAVAHMSAQVGDTSIEGFAPGGVELAFADLEDTMESTVRVEIAYHGQAEDAGDDLDVWLADFWTGSACPTEPPYPVPVQPHCPVWYAATFGIES